MDWETILVTGLVAILSAVVGGVIGAYGALRVSKVDNAAADTRGGAERAATLALSREERVENRREKAYLEILLAMDTFAELTYKLSFGPLPTTVEEVRALIAAIPTEQQNRGRALSRFGSPEVRKLYEASLTAATYWRAGASQAEMRERWEGVRASIAAISAQIEVEMSRPEKEA